MNDGTRTVGQVASRYGTPEPQIEVRMPKGTPFRRLHAALHRLAADVELATPTTESWIVQVDATSDERGRVNLELAKGDEAEAARLGAPPERWPVITAPRAWTSGLPEAMHDMAGAGPSGAMMTSVLYFAYGSNLDGAQMRARCPSAVRDARATLPGHALAFGGFSHRWGGAVASVVRARGREVPGLLYRIGRDEVALLDRSEGSPHAYQRIVRVVVDERGRRRRAHLYVQPEEDFLRWAPPIAYFDVIRRAYARLGFERRGLVEAIAGGAA